MNPQFYDGSESDLMPLMRAVSPQAWRGDPRGEMTPRLVLADLMDELGRHDEANLLRDVKRHLYVDFGGRVEDAHELSRQLSEQGRNTSRVLQGDRFAQSYVDGLLSTSVDDQGMPFDMNTAYRDRMGFDSIHPDTLAAMVADAHHFRHFHGDDEMYSYGQREGRNLALSRNGHGSGFFDDDSFGPEDQQRLQQAAKSHGEYDLYLGDDGMIHGTYEVSPTPPDTESTPEYDPNTPFPQDNVTGYMDGTFNETPTGPTEYDADESTIAAYLQLLQQEEHNHTRWATPNQADMNLRLTMADAFQDMGREQEAQLLRDPNRHVVVQDGQVLPGRFTAGPAFQAHADFLNQANEFSGGDYPYPELDVLAPGNEGQYRPEDFHHPDEYAGPIPPGHFRVVDIDPGGADYHNHVDVHASELPNQLFGQTSDHHDLFGDYDFQDDENEILEQMLSNINNAPFEEVDTDALNPRQDNARYAGNQQTEPPQQQTFPNTVDDQRRSAQDTERRLTDTDQDDTRRVGGHTSTQEFSYARTDYSHKAFVNSIRKDPNDSNPRVVFADWLEENDPNAKPETVNFLRHHQGPAWIHHDPYTNEIWAGPKLTLDDIRAANGEHFRTENPIPGQATGTHHFGLLPFWEDAEGYMMGHGSTPTGHVYSGPGGHYITVQHSFPNNDTGYSVYQFHPENGGLEETAFHWHPEDSHERARAFSIFGVPIQRPYAGEELQGELPDLADLPPDDLVIPPFDENDGYGGIPPLDLDDPEQLSRYEAGIVDPPKRMPRTRPTFPQSPRMEKGAIYEDGIDYDYTPVSEFNPEEHGDFWDWASQNAPEESDSPDEQEGWWQEARSLPDSAWGQQPSQPNDHPAMGWLSPDFAQPQQPGTQRTPSPTSSQPERPSWWFDPLPDDPSEVDWKPGMQPPGSASPEFGRMNAQNSQLRNWFQGLYPNEQDDVVRSLRSPAQIPPSWATQRPLNQRGKKGGPNPDVDSTGSMDFPDRMWMEMIQRAEDPNFVRDVLGYPYARQSQYDCAYGENTPETASGTDAWTSPYPHNAGRLKTKRLSVPKSHTQYAVGDERRGFQSAISTNPYDGNTHTAFADWLDENGMPEEGSFHRVLGDWLMKDHEWTPFSGRRSPFGFLSVQGRPVQPRNLRAYVPFGLPLERADNETPVWGGDEGYDWVYSHSRWRRELPEDLVGVWEENLPEWARQEGIDLPRVIDDHSRPGILMWESPAHMKLDLRHAWDASQSILPESPVASPDDIDQNQTNLSRYADKGEWRGSLAGIPWRESQVSYAEPGIPPFPSHEMHPDLRFTRLGAYLRKHANEQNDVGALARGALTHPHDQPAEMHYLHLLRDLLMPGGEYEQHPMAKEFNWDTLPETFSFDQNLRRLAKREYVYGGLPPEVYPEGDPIHSREPSWQQYNEIADVASGYRDRDRYSSAGDVVSQMQRLYPHTVDSFLPIFDSAHRSARKSMHGSDVQQEIEDADVLHDRMSAYPGLDDEGLTIERNDPHRYADDDDGPVPNVPEFTWTSPNPEDDIDFPDDVGVHSPQDLEHMPTDDLHVLHQQILDHFDAAFAPQYEAWTWPDAAAVYPNYHDSYMNVMAEAARRGVQLPHPERAEDDDYDDGLGIDGDYLEGGDEDDDEEGWYARVNYAGRLRGANETHPEVGQRIHDAMDEMEGRAENHNYSRADYADTPDFSAPQHENVGDKFHKRVWDTSHRDGYTHQGYVLVPQPTPDGGAIWVLEDGQPHPIRDRHELQSWVRGGHFFPGLFGGVDLSQHDLRDNIMQPLDTDEFFRSGLGGVNPGVGMHPDDANARAVYADWLDDQGHTNEWGESLGDDVRKEAQWVMNRVRDAGPTPDHLLPPKFRSPGPLGPDDIDHNQTNLSRYADGEV